ncbi:MAG: PilZ domain-containing protein [Candidatus Omnitrophica bacterium]|nr:PilZ domain-containing protein [Candidatus Omnitrophota bacterium]
MDERRKWKRYPIAYPVEQGDELTDIVFDTVDISQGGVSFCCTQPLKFDEKLSMRIFLKKKMFFIEAVIVYTKKLKDNFYAIGAKFNNCPEDFPVMLQKEIAEITILHKENNLYKNKSTSFRETSEEYLKNLSSTGV